MEKQIVFALKQEDLITLISLMCRNLNIAEQVIFAGIASIAEIGRASGRERV